MVFACKDLQVLETPKFSEYISKRDGEQGMLQKIIYYGMCGVSKEKAKNLVIMTLTLYGNRYAQTTHISENLT